MLIVKFGGSVLFPGPRGEGFAPIAGLVRRLKSLKGGKIIIHGTGFFGKKPAVRYSYHKEGIIDPLSLPVERIKLDLLRSHVRFLEFLVKKGLRAVSLDPCSVFRPGRTLSVGNLSPLKALISCGLVPVLGGDVFFQGGLARVVSSDEMAKALALAFLPRKTVFITKTRGILLPGGRTLKRAVNAELPSIISGMRPSLKDVSGGMRGKMLQIKKISDAGLDVLIGDRSSGLFSVSDKDFKGTFIYGKKKNKRHYSGL